MNFKVLQLDHIAIRVKDMEKSAKWYRETLGFKRVQPKEWGDFPIMMIGTNSGVALFPGKTKNPAPLPEGDWLVPFHFAFRVNRSSLDYAIDHFRSLNIEFEFQELIHFHSVFIKDPDGHRVELTAQVKPLD